MAVSGVNVMMVGLSLIGFVGAAWLVAEDPRVPGYLRYGPRADTCQRWDSPTSSWLMAGLPDRWEIGPHDQVLPPGTYVRLVAAKGQSAAVVWLPGADGFVEHQNAWPGAAWARERVREYHLEEGTAQKVAELPRLAVETP